LLFILRLIAIFSAETGVKLSVFDCEPRLVEALSPVFFLNHN
jgi:hypothetical protein